jgi:uncharacterized membrane protein
MYLITIEYATFIFVFEDMSVKTDTLTYLVGMFLRTVVKNVLLNHSLEMRSDRAREGVCSHLLSN